MWDATNRFYSGYTTTYSGTYYNLRPGDPGWSAMSGNYGSWWGQNFHIRKCDAGLHGQFDLKDSSGAKFYTRFYHGRWMRG